MKTVFLSSTSRDLSPYRDEVYKAIEGLGGFHCVRMEDFGGRDSDPETFCRNAVAGCDLFVGLVGFLHGSCPPGSALSFTEIEFETAVKTGRSRLMFLATEKFEIPASLLTEAAAGLPRQESFRQRVGDDRIAGRFSSPVGLVPQVMQALLNWERDHRGSGGAQPDPPGRDLAADRQRFLSYLADTYQYLDFRGMGTSERIPQKLPLLDAYIPLQGRLEVPDPGEGKSSGPGGPGENVCTSERCEPRLLLDLLRSHHGLVVLGNPGSGKTTFLKYLILKLATQKGEEVGLPGPLLPVPLPLSAYATALAAEDLPLDRFIPRFFRDRGVDLPVGELLESALQEGRALLLLDAIDEVSEDLRHLVVERVRDFYNFHRKAGNKFVLTSRIVGYWQVRPQADGLAECVLTDFEDPEISAFIEQWTKAVERISRGDTVEAADAARQEQRDLLRAVHGSRAVRALASNPMLLTILALLKRQGVVLPEHRAALYQTYLEVLLRNWNLVRSLGGRPDPGGRDPDLARTLKILAPLALWMHETSPGLGLVKEKDLERRLAEILRQRGNEEPDREAQRFLSDIREHAGLLEERGRRQYAFQHVTLQEYLAALALAQKAQHGAGTLVDALADHVGKPSWHEVGVLAIAYLAIVLQWDELAGEVVEELVQRAPGPPGEAALLAGRALLDIGPGGLPQQTRSKVIAALLAILKDDRRVPAAVRAAAGRLLADLGDPRPEVTTLAGLELRTVPAGAFRMGEGRSRRGKAGEHVCDIPYEFRISRYPVTVAQYREYLEQSGREPGDPEALRGGDNRPMVAVTWFEAMELCRWLARIWREEGRIGKGWTVRLPSEAEWEKAARGPDGRSYPWGDNPGSGLANHHETGVKETSAVGCFPSGESSYGCEEMSGNVWEWTQTLWGRDWQRPAFSYPYEAADGREDPEAPPEVLRVLRGGSYFNPAERARSTSRDWQYPNLRSLVVGFRIVAAPETPSVNDCQSSSPGPCSNDNSEDPGASRKARKAVRTQRGHRKGTI